jgi:hypothetical protein
MRENNNTLGEVDHDDALWAELRDLADACDSVPADDLDTARAALAWRSFDAEVAELVAESVGGEPAVVRGARKPTLLTFEAGDLALEVGLFDHGRDHRLLGQLIPPASGVVEVRHRGGTDSVAADDVGRFTARHVSRGPVSLRCSSGTKVVETDWFLA